MRPEVSQAEYRAHAENGTYDHGERQPEKRVKDRSREMSNQ
jgi:hypothetical protein